MTIKYANGTRMEALMLSESAVTLRVAVKGVEDATTYQQVHGVWIAETCGPVEIEMDWEKKAGAAPDVVCICSKELAERMIRLLREGAAEKAAVERCVLPQHLEETCVA